MSSIRAQTTVRNAIALYTGKIIHVSLNNGGYMEGKFVQVSDEFVIMETRFSMNHCFRLTELSSFWCDEDKPKD